MSQAQCNPQAQALVAKSPRLALACAWDLDFVPYVFTITGTFSTAGSPDPLLALTPSKNIQVDLLVQTIDVDVQTANAFTGDEFKPQNDWYYDATSGIQTRIAIDGYNRRSTPYFPLKALPAFASPEAPWTLLEEQALSMDFSVTTALPSAGTVITVTYVCRTPAGDQVFRMSSTEAFNCLDQLGYCTEWGRKSFGCS